MFNKVLISSLSLCLLAVVGLYVYSNTQVETKKSVPNQAASTPSRPTNTATPNNTTAITPEDQQPDKSLPVPAHQLKKVIARASTYSEDALQAKIAAANQAIHTSDQQLSDQSLSPAVTPVNNDEPDKPNNIQTRLQHIQNHLAK